MIIQGVGGTPIHSGTERTINLIYDGKVDLNDAAEGFINKDIGILMRVGGWKVQKSKD